MLLSDNLSLLFHPRNYPFFLSAVFFLMLMFYIQSRNLIYRKYINNINKSVFIFLLPIFAFTVAISNKWNINKIIHSQNSLITTSPQSSSPQKEEKDILKADTFILTDENYFSLYNAISGSLDMVVGKNIEVSGYIFREKHYNKNEIVIARDLMWCCAADIAVIGFYCVIDDFDKFKVNSWIKVKGSLDRFLYHNIDSGRDYYIPSINIKSIEATIPPENSYIYPL